MRLPFSISPTALLFLLAIASLRPTVADEPKQDALTAQQILDRMAKTYANCKSYRDSGVVKTVFVEADGNRIVEKPFTTAFVRPDRFRFEYKEGAGGKARRYIVWRSGKDVQTWWDVMPGIKKPESLSLALAGATGVSGGSAHTVPRLLMSDELGGRRLTELTEAQRDKDAKLDKAECFLLQGKFGGSPMTLWIDKQSFLVRRIDAHKAFGNFRTEQTTTYDPFVGGAIADNMMEFDPPRQR